MTRQPAADITAAMDEVDNADGPLVVQDLDQASGGAGVRSLGLTTAVQPTASANGSFWETIKSGKFHGVITPTHRRFLDRHRQVVGPRWLWASPYACWARLAA